MSGADGRNDDAVTIENLDRTDILPVVATGGLSIEDRGFDERYAMRDLLGAGGMGQVHLCRDQRIGRDVAMKVIQPGFASLGDLRARFLREARVQGQLEHPAIVPVYDMGVAPDGSAYFTMKRIQGSAFDRVIERLRDGTERRTLRQLLAAFSSLCQAIDFAHAHGVVHRDLKPANLMLGEFGETYVLDWGLAKVGNVEEEPQVDAFATTTDPEVKTVHGRVMGTPGYMAPEQLRGLEVDARADVYSLGVVLFELLALEPLHPRRSFEQIVSSTTTGVDARPSVRTPERDLPELDAICVRATALDPDERFSARELSEAIERFLDGDRDLARRRELSIQHADTAERAARTGDLASRRHAMHELGRALALDPDNARALRTMAGLLLSPPSELPPEAELAIEKAKDDAVRVSARAGGTARLSVLLLAPLAVWMGIRDGWVSMLIVGAMLLAALLAFVNARMQHPRTFIRDLELGTSVLATMSLALIFGPFIVVPTVATVTAGAFSLNAFTTLDRIKVAVLNCLSIVVPAALQLTGVWAPSYAFENGTMIVLPQVASISQTSSVAFLLATSCVIVVAAAFFSSLTRSALSRAERQIQIHAWHLQQLVPAPALAPADDDQRSRVLT